MARHALVRDAHGAEQMTTSRLTIDQAVIVSGYTGILCCAFSALHADIERRLGRPVWTHELGNEEMRERLRDAYRADFLAICAAGTPTAKGWAA